MSASRCNITIPTESLEAIDKAAESRGMNRSQFLTAAGLELAAGDSGALSPSQRKALRAGFAELVSGL